MSLIKYFSKEETSWILYDVGNSAFMLIVATTIAPLFFKDIAAPGSQSSQSTAYWAWALSISSLIIAFIAPFLGLLADLRKMKKQIFLSLLSLSLLMTILMTFVSAGQWFIFLFLFVIANIGFWGAHFIYDSLLIDITIPSRFDWISSCGYAFGYIGSSIPFIVCIIFIYLEQKNNQIQSITAFSSRMSFLITVFWWALFSIPLLIWGKQKSDTNQSALTKASAIKKLTATLKKIRQQKDMITFLMAYFFYINGVESIIGLSVAYGREINLSVGTLVLAVLLVQVIAFPGALIFGRLARIYSARKMILAGIAVYIIITLIGFALPGINHPQLKKTFFWIIALLVATSMGGIQALSRSLYARFIPHGHSGEYFGFFFVFTKLAVILGPLLFGIITQVTGESRFGILTLLVFFLIGGRLMNKVKNQTGG